MRRREEILENVKESSAKESKVIGNETTRLLQLESLLALLDIRDQQAEILDILRDVTANRKQVSTR